MKNEQWVEYVLKHTRYSKETGQIFWAIPARGRKRNKPLGGPDNNGYIKCQVGNRSTYAHILVWIHEHGYVPGYPLDHINRNPADNRIENLRPTNARENMLNRPIAALNQTGVRGVYTTAYGKYRTTIAGKYLGTFSSIAEAKEAIHGQKV